MSNPCTQVDRIVKSETHIEHFYNDIKDIKSDIKGMREEDIKKLREEISSMKGFAAGVGAASGLVAAIMVKLAGKILGVAAAAATVIR